MKKTILLGVLFIMCAFAQAQRAQSKAIVNSVQGVYVFIDSQPSADYQVLGREKGWFSWSGTYIEMRNKLVKKALKKYPNAEGIIIEMGANEMKASRAVVIKFEKSKAVEIVEE